MGKLKAEASSTQEVQELLKSAARHADLASDGPKPRKGSDSPQKTKLENLKFEMIETFDPAKFDPAKLEVPPVWLGLRCADRCISGSKS